MGNVVEEHQSEHAQDKSGGFSGTRSGDDEQRSFGWSLDGLQLIRIGSAAGGLSEQLLEVREMHALQIRLEDQGLAE